MKISLSILTPIIKQNKLLLLTTLFCAVADGILRVALSAGVGVWIGQVLHRSTGKARFWDAFIGVKVNMNIGLLILVVLKIVFAFGVAYFTGMIAEKTAKFLREQQFERHLQLNLSAHQQKAKGKYLLRYSGDMGSVQTFLTKGIILFLADITFLISAFVILCFISLAIPAYLALWLLLCLLPIGGVTYRLRKTVIRRRDLKSIMLNFVSQRLTAFFTIKVHNRETPEFGRFEKQSGKLYAIGVKYHLFSALQIGLSQLAVYGCLLIALWYFATHPHIALVENITMFTLIIFYTIPVLKRMLRTSLIWQNGLISLNKLSSFPIVKYPSKKGLGKVNGHLTLQDIGFSFPNSNTTLFNHLTLNILPHGITYIVGQSGCGKSTLLELIAAIRSPKSGSIMLDGKNYAQIHPFELRKHLVLLSADAKLLGKTIFEAVSYSRNEEKRPNALKWLKEVGFTLKGVPESNWLNYQIGDHGERLSDSERHLVAWARVLATRKKIMLLDEPFSHLDEIQQQPIIALLTKLSHKRTIIIADERINDRLPVKNIYALSQTQLNIAPHPTQINL